LLSAAKELSFAANGRGGIDIHDRGAAFCDDHHIRCPAGRQYFSDAIQYHWGLTMTFVFQTLDDTAATHGTEPSGVDNNGNIVGFYLDASNNQVGFYLPAGGNFEDVVSPFNNITAVPHGLSELGALAGTAIDGGDSFAFFEQKGALVLIGPPGPGTQSMNANGINNNNWVVGDVSDGTTERGFLYIAAGGLKLLNDPLAGSLGTIARGINDLGKIVGGYFDSSGAEHGFIFNKGTGTWTTLNDPLGINTECEGINDKGQIVGIYFANGVEHGFLATKVNGKYVFTDVDDPLGVKGTGALGINNHGEIVGIYYDAADNLHGFHT
jgi:uncharacterized membrane protein